MTTAHTVMVGMSTGATIMATDHSPGPPPSPDELAATARLLHATAHPVRLAVLLRLEREGPLTAGELLEGVDLEQSALSHQLRVLREARLVRGERSGKHVIYELMDHHVAHIVRDALLHVREEGH